ncbi:peptidylprolyl isomerase [Jannaschia sp. R86511]|uniref:peptidylprolyl isomerase n=1 Tax=Jannaschia sp. R86511 TaxID=3093853 RepID=UPI0036D34BD4
MSPTRPRHRAPVPGPVLPTAAPRRPHLRPLLLGAGALLVPVLAGCSAVGPAVGTAVDPAAGAAARVGDPAGVHLVVTHEDLQRRLATLEADPDVAAAMAQDDGVAERLAADTLAQLVQARLVDLAAADLDVRVSEADVDRHLDQVAADALGDDPDAWQTFLASSGYKEEEVRQQLAEDHLRERVEDALLPAPRPDPADVARAYDEGWRDRPLVAHVLLAEQEQAEEVHARLAGGEPMAEIAPALSLDTASAAQGGELGPWTKGQYVASFDEAVERHPEPGLLDPVASPFGWHVIEVSAPASAEAAGPGIEASLAERAQDEAFDAWVTDLRDSHDVELDPALGRWDAATGRVQP